MRTDKKRNARSRTIGLVASIGVHLILFFCFIFLMAWREPVPPIPQYGIEIRLGFDEAGSTERVPNQSPQMFKDAEFIEEKEKPIEEEIDLEETMDTADPTMASPSNHLDNTHAIVNANPAKRVKPPVNRKSKKQIPKPKAVGKKAAQLPTSTTKPPLAVYNKTATKKKHGDKVNTSGDQGNEKGTLDAKALYGNQGGGVGLKLVGWDWDEIPRPYIPHDESGGRIEFEIKVDRNGEIIGYRVLERSLSVSAERACRNAISKLTFTKKAGATVPAVSVGKITFVVRAR